MSRRLQCQTLLYLEIERFADCTLQFMQLCETIFSVFFLFYLYSGAACVLQTAAASRVIINVIVIYAAGMPTISSFTMHCFANRIFSLNIYLNTIYTTRTTKKVVSFCSFIMYYESIRKGRREKIRKEYLFEQVTIIVISSVC